MTITMVAPAWMHEQLTVAEYTAWTETQCTGIEIVDGVFTGVVNVSAPFTVEIDLGQI